MNSPLFDNYGRRKYLIASECRSFINAAQRHEIAVASFCLTLAITGARISEILALTREGIDINNRVVVLRTLKQRSRVEYRAIPVPVSLLTLIRDLNVAEGCRLWPWGRTTAWKIVKTVMGEAAIVGPTCMPKALRHAFAVGAGQSGVPLNIVQRWLGHARIETTAIYAQAVGPEERRLAQLNWNALQVH